MYRVQLMPIYIFNSMLSHNHRRFGTFSICCFVVYLTGVNAVVGVNISVGACRWSMGTTVVNMDCIFCRWIVTLCSDVTWASWRPQLKPAIPLLVEQLVLANIAEYIIISPSNPLTTAGSPRQGTSAWSLSGVPDYFDRNKISSGGDLSHYSSGSLY